MSLPGEIRYAKSLGLAAGYVHRSAGTVHDNVVPLVEYYESIITVGNATSVDGVKIEVPIRIALGEGDRGAIRIAQGSVAVGIPQHCVIARIARESSWGKDPATIELLIRRTRLVQVRDLAIDMVAAWRGKWYSGVCRSAAYSLQSCVDMLGVGHSEKHVESTGSKLLKVGRFTRLDERVQFGAAVQRVRLMPFLAVRLSGSSRMRSNREFPLHEVLNNGLAREG